MNAKTKTAHPAAAGRIHARRRCLERYGVDLSDRDLDRIEGLIRAGVPSPDCVPIRGFFDADRTLHAVRFAFRLLPCLFSRRGNCLVTVLPPHVLRRHGVAADRAVREAS